MKCCSTTSTTCYSDQGVIPIDDTLIDHDGKFIKDVGWFWDHAEARNKIAHDYLFVNYVCTSGKHYPLEFRRFKKREQCEATGETFQDHTQLFCQLIDWVCEREIPGGFRLFDSYFTNARKNLNHIPLQAGQRRASARAYVGDSDEFNRKLEWKGKEISRATPWRRSVDSAGGSQGTRAAASKGGGFTCTLHIPKVSPQGTNCHSLENIMPRRVAAEDGRDQSPQLGKCAASWARIGVAEEDRHGDLSSGR